MSVNNILSRIILLSGLALILISPAAFGNMYNVRDYGAKGDGKTDDTAAFQKTLDEAGKNNGGIVFAPTGNYLIKTHLAIPDFVTLEGVWRSPTSWSENKGTTLLAVEGAGKPDDTPFITLFKNSTIKGVTVFYPNQTETNPPVAYPWCIASGGADNCSIIDVLLVNPYMAVDFGTRVAGRHYIKNLYGQPLYKGLFIDQCYDVGRVEDVHFWPFWKYAEGSPLAQFIQEKAEGFILGRTDWEYMSNCFTIFYSVGFHFIKKESGPGNVLLNTCGADICHTAVLVDDCQSHAGISFSNSQMYGDITIKDTNTGPVKFTGCGLFGSTLGRGGFTHAKIAGSGQISFSNCHFLTLDPKNKANRVIYAESGGLSIIGCDFMDVGREHVFLDKGVQSAVIMGNRFRGIANITNRSHMSVSIMGNAEDKRDEEKEAIIIDNTSGDDSFKTEGEWTGANVGGGYLGNLVWAKKGKGECKAAWTPDIPSDGVYQVFVWYGMDVNDDHAANAPFTISHKDGSKEIKVNFKKNSMQWYLLGEFPFEKGKKGYVTLTNAADQNIVADAVKFLPVKK